MATLFQQNNRNVIQFSVAEARKTISLGAISAASARKILGHIEQAEDELNLLGRLSAETLAWMRDTPLAMRRKFASAGLIPREQQSLTLTASLFKFEGSLTVKASTLTFYGHTIRNIRDCYGSDATAASITDGQKFVKYLIEQGLAKPTRDRRIVAARTIWNWLIAQGYAETNPFKGIEVGSQRNDARKFHVKASIIHRVIDNTADPNMKITIALARFAGLRCPSEIHLLRWRDIDWNTSRMYVRSPKTEHHEGGAMREVPIFAALLPYLRDAYDRAPVGAEYVIGELVDATGNALTSRLEKILRRLNIPRWVRLWQNLRASCETDLLDDFVGHAVAAWMGHSELIQQKHYATVKDELFRRAAVGAAIPSSPVVSGDARIGDIDSKTHSDTAVDGGDWAVRDSRTARKTYSKHARAAIPLYDKFDLCAAYNRVIRRRARQIGGSR